jgi:hypothetical protein
VKFAFSFYISPICTIIYCSEANKILYDESSTKKEDLKMAKEYKKLLIERKGVTVEKEPETLKISIGNDSVFDKDSHKQSEEVGYVLVEGSPVRRIFLEAEISANELEALERMTYPEKFEALLKVFGAEKISDLSDEKKKEFFNTLDEVHVSKEESGEVEVPHKQAEISVSESSVVISIPAEGLSEELDSDSEEILQECLRIIHSKLSHTSLSEETVSVPSEAEAEISFSGDSIVIELPIESPKSEVSEEEAEEINEAVSMAGIILEKFKLRSLLPLVPAAIQLGYQFLTKDSGGGGGGQIPGDVGNEIVQAIESGGKNVLDNIGLYTSGGLLALQQLGPRIRAFLDNKNKEKLRSKILSLTPQEREDYKLMDAGQRAEFLKNKKLKDKIETKNVPLSPRNRAEEELGIPAALKPTNSNNPPKAKVKPTPGKVITPAVTQTQTAGQSQPVLTASGKPGRVIQKGETSQFPEGTIVPLDHGQRVNVKQSVATPTAVTTPASVPTVSEPEIVASGEKTEAEKAPQKEDNVDPDNSATSISSDKKTGGN